MAARLFLVDGSAYVYRAFFALPPLTSPTGMPTNAAYGFTTMLLKLLADARPSLLALVFDAPGRTFRDDLYEDYKANRSEAPDELACQWPVIHEIADAFKVNTLTIPGVEADDVIGTLTRRATEQGIDVVVVTSDKDLMQLVGPHAKLWDTMKDKWTDEAGVQQRFGVGPAQVADVLGLMGDSIDNIPGIKGIGEKTATALIQHFGSLDAALARPEEVESIAGLRGAKKVAELLRAQAEQARLSRDLATIHCDVPLEVVPAELVYSGPDAATLRLLFNQLGFQTLLKNLPATAPMAAAEVVHLERPDEVRQLAGGLAAQGRVALACATSGSPMSGSCEGIAIGGGERVAFVPCTPPLREAIAAITGNAALLKVGYNLKSDIVRLGRLDVPMVGPLFDCMVAAAMLGVSAVQRLEDVVRDVLNEEIPPFRFEESGAAGLASGIEHLARLQPRLEAQLQETGMASLFADVEMPLLEVLARMERRGVLVDTRALAQMGQEWREQLDRLTGEIYELAGGEFNIGSPVQLRDILFEKLKLSSKGVKRGKTGGLSTDVDVLTRLSQDHPLPAKILEHRALAKLLSTYVDALIAATNPETGRVHTIFNQTGAATGRLSSNDPNLQNIPVRGDEGRRIRSAFTPDPGWLFIAADYSQIELRVMAHLSKDPGLVAAFRSGQDIHATTAADIFSTLPGLITPDMRRIAKVINFGIMYGMGPQRLANELGIPHAAAQRYIEQYFERYQGVRRFMEATIAHGRETGYVSTAFGRRRAVPELQSRHRATQQAAERAAINMPIQGTAADLIKIAMVHIDQRLRREGLRSEMVLQVHDELILEAPEVEVETATAVVREEMENVAALDVPLLVDVGVGKSWAEAH